LGFLRKKLDLGANFASFVSDEIVEELCRRSSAGRPTGLKPKSKQTAYRSGEPLRHPKPIVMSGETLRHPKKSVNRNRCG
jgi:hypothetical protein